MAGKSGQEIDTLIGRLAAKPYALDFFQAVRRLEGSLPAGAARVGHSGRPAEDPIRFGQHASLAFAPSALASCALAAEDRPAKLVVNCFGLLGPNGPMPLHFTEYVRNRARQHGDRTLIEFLDVFHHRLICFFYRAWAENQQTASYERAGRDRYVVYVASLFGLGMPSLRGRDEVRDVAKLHYAGRLACQAKNAEGLEAILGDYFKVPCLIEQFVGRWMDLAQDCRCRLGRSPGSSALGRTAIVGSRIWECQEKFRIVLGPMGLSDYRRFLPGEGSMRRLVAWVRMYIGDEFRWDVRLVLKVAEIPQTRLGLQGRLGWTTWLGTVRPTKGTESLVLASLGG